MSVVTKGPTLTSAKVVRETNKTTVIERYIVDNLDGSVGQKALYDATFLPGIPQLSIPHAYAPLAFTTRIEADALATGQYEIVATSETPTITGTSGGTSDWVITDDISLIQTTTEVDRDGKPLQVAFTTPALGGGVVGNTTIKTVSAQVYLPTRTVTAQKTITGAPPDAWRDAVFSVNDRTWLGEEKGKWLFFGLRSQSTDGGATYAVVITVLFNPLTWATDGVFRNEHGEIPTLQEADTQGIKNAGYNSSSHNGIIRRLWYPEANFASVFSIG